MDLFLTELVNGLTLGSVYALLALGYLFLPIAIVIAFSFNNPAGRFNYTWEGFTFKNWTDPFGYPGVKDAVKVSVEIAALSSVAATVLGTLIALALIRYRFVGRGLINLLIFMPLTTPEIGETVTAANARFPSPL